MTSDLARKDLSHFHLLLFPDSVLCLFSLFICMVGSGEGRGKKGDCNFIVSAYFPFILLIISKVCKISVNK